MTRTAKSVEENNPRTPFEALRILLEIELNDWATQNDLTRAQLYNYESGNSITPIDIAKRIQDEARKKGIALTLDELYQNVAPFGEEFAKLFKKKERSLLRRNEALRRKIARREQEMELRKVKREEFIAKEKAKRELEKELRMNESQSIEVKNSM